jgi:hypothetical protein
MMHLGAWRVKYVEEDPHLVSKQKMVVMWDVCTEHKDACWFLGTWMPEHCPPI